jgi:glyceraldehyde-3-phosphate dehydrogenase/erythrose-4-phosphate dehydrogenase
MPRTSKPAPDPANASPLTTPLDDPRAERARRAAMQSYIEGRTTHAQAIERVRRAIEKYSTPAA